MLFRVDKNNDDASFTIIERTISLAALGDVIDQKHVEYIEKFHAEPQFIKLPLWVYRIILKYPGFIRVDCDTRNETVYGLTVCPTISIDDPSDIEVF